MYMHFFSGGKWCASLFRPEAKKKKIDDNLFPRIFGEKREIVYNLLRSIPPHPTPSLISNASNRYLCFASGFSPPFSPLSISPKTKFVKTLFFSKIDLLFILRLFGKMRMEKNDKKMPAHPNGGGGRRRNSKGRKAPKTGFFLFKKSFFREKRDRLYGFC